MTRTSSILSLVLAALAVAAAPAAADPGFQTDAFLGSHPAPSSTVNADVPGYGGDTKDLYVQSLPPSQPTPTATATVGGDGFGLGDALLGVLLASGLLVGVFAATRRRRVSAESHA